MKSKLLLVLVPALFLLTACGQNSDQATEDLTRACDLFNANKGKSDFMPDVAIEFFASAARADVKYLPIVQAAKLGQLTPYVYGVNEALSNDVLKARSLIIGYCLPRKAK